MQKSKYHLRGFLIPLVIAGTILLLSSGCRKDEVPGKPPTITLMSDSGYTCHDTSLVIGGRINIGIRAVAGGGNITFFQASCNDGTRKILLDSGLNNADLIYRQMIIKSASTYERWTFLVMDRDRNMDSISVIIRKADSSNYGKIRILSDIVMGAQDNLTYGSFLSFSSAVAYPLDTAYTRQALTDLIYYFGQYEGTLSSPAEAEAPSIFTGPSGIAGWTIKNETRYDTTTLTTQSFDQATDDSLILAVYEPTAGKRKAKFITPGMVVSFKSADGKIGLIKVSGTEPGSAGRITISIKIQD